MATKELRVLRHKYRTAYTAYMSCVHALSDAGENGDRPPNDLLEAEAEALSALMAARGSFLAAILRDSGGHG
jgi:hypothetical protein